MGLPFADEEAEQPAAGVTSLSLASMPGQSLHQALDDTFFHILGSHISTSGYVPGLKALGLAGMQCGCDVAYVFGMMGNFGGDILMVM